jgi:hypothetical protein
MLIKSKISNIKSVALDYLVMEKNLESPTTEDIESITAVHFSCKLCLRFLNEPVKHEECGSYFCKECIISWTEEFPFCPNCKFDLTNEEIQKKEIHLEMQNLIQKIKILCHFGTCILPVVVSNRGTTKDLQISTDKNSKYIKNKLNFPQKKNHLEQIEERSMEHDISSEHPSIPGFWDGDIQYSIPKKFNFINLSKHKNKINQRDDKNRRRNKSKKYMQNILEEEEKFQRTYTVKEFMFHLMRQHYWPPMEIKCKHLKNNNQINFASSLKKEQFLLSNSDSDYSTYIDHDKMKSMAFSGFVKNQKAGPGVIYYVKKNRNIDSHFGIFQKDNLNEMGTIINNGKLVFDGSIQNGKKEGMAIQRFYMEIDKNIHLKSIVDQVKDRIGYIEYRGYFKNGKRHGFGKLLFNGNFNVFREYFEKISLLKNFNENEKDEEEEEYCPFGIPVITNYVDSNFNIDKIFKKVPVVLVNSEICDISEYNKGDESTTMGGGNFDIPC